MNLISVSFIHLRKYNIHIPVYYRLLQLIKDLLTVLHFFSHTEMLTQVKPSLCYIVSFSDKLTNGVIQLEKRRRGSGMT